MRAIFTAVLCILLTALSGAVRAQADDLVAYDLRSVAFNVPADWKMTHSTRDQEYDFESPDKTYQLWARWWYPDEPLLGYSDIVRHEARELAGQEALFIHTETGVERFLQMAFLKKDEDGEIFLFQLISSQASLADHEATFNALLSQITLDGIAVQTATAPKPAVVAPVNRRPGDGVFQDAEGAFAVPMPQGWDVQTTASQGLRQAVLVSPDRDALLLAVVGRPDRGLTGAQVLDDYLGILYRDSLVVKSIEDEGYPQIAGTTVHAVEYIAKIYAINGVAMPYTRGRVWLYRSDEETEARAPFLIVSIRPQDAAQDLTAELKRMALGFTFDTGSAPIAPIISGQPAVSDAPQVAVVAPAAERPVVERPAAEQPASGLIFDGRSLAGLTPFAFNSAEFETHAKLTGNAIEFGFPDRKGWALLGFATQTEVVQSPKRDDGSVQRITAIIDADKSSGISFALTPLESAQKDPYEVHDLHFQFSTVGDGIGNLEVNLREPKNTIRAQFTWPKGEAVLHVLLRPDQVVEVRDGIGTQLVELALPSEYGGRRWALQTYLQVHYKNGAASLVLKRVSVDAIPFQPSPKPDAIASDGQPVVIFDGFAIGRLWEKTSRYTSDVPRYISQSDGALRIAWTVEDANAWSGIATPAAALWLDRFRGTAEARVDLAVDGAASKDFEISLQNRYALPGNLSGNGAYVLRFTQQPDGTYHALSALRADEKNGLLAEGLSQIPDRISLVLTPEGIRTQGDGLPDGVLPFAQAVDGVGLRIAIHAMRTVNNDGALVLRGVRTAMRPGPYTQPPKPAPGITPFPQNVLFDARPSEAWTGETFGKAVFSELAVQGMDGLTLTRRDPVPDWSRIALIGTQIVADLDYRVETTPYELKIALDPARRIGVRLFLHNNPAQFEKAAISILTLRELTEGPDLGGLEVQLHTGHFSYDRWRRVIPADKWTRDWDGTVRLQLGPDWIKVALQDDWLMHGPRRGSEIMMAVTPGGVNKTDSGSVTLRRITGGLVTPNGMSGTERMRLGETADFDPNTYLDFLAAETGVPTL